MPADRRWTRGATIGRLGGLPLFQLTIAPQNVFITISQGVSYPNPMSAYDGSQRLILPFPGLLQAPPQPDPIPTPVESAPPAREESGWSLRRCFDAWKRETIENQRAKLTLSGYMTSLGHWETWVRKCGVLDSISSAPTGDPAPVAACGYAWMADFRAYLQRPQPLGAGLGLQSVRRIETNLFCILREARKRRAIDELPELPKLKMVRKRPGGVSLGELQRLIDACDVATWPRLGRITPRYFWETLFLAFWIYGPRTQDFFAYRDSSVSGLLWSGVHTEPACPDNGVRCSHASGWVEWQPRKTEHSVGLPVLMPLHEALRPRIEAFRGLHPERVWPIGRSGKTLFGQFRAIRDAAGLDSTVTISGDARHGQRSIRKGCSNNWDDVEQGLGKIVLAHSAADVNESHYRQSLPKLVRLLGQLAVPSMPVRDGQLRLW